MTICREWTASRTSPTEGIAHLLRCKCWDCEYCQPIRKKQLLAQCARGKPNRFLTLTVNPDEFSSPEERLEKLAWAWRTCVKILRRKYGRKNVEYLAVVEATKKGEPHLHILLRSAFIPQQLISRTMGRLINSPIVDIRRIKSQREVVRYVGKYITKKPAQFGTKKRYWQSTAYQEGPPAKETETIADSYPWEIWRGGTRELYRVWTSLGFSIHQEAENTWVAKSKSTTRRPRGSPASVSKKA